MRDPVPPAEARAPGDDFLGALAAEALEELVDDQASRRPREAALSMELPPLRLQDAGHGFCSGGGVGAAKTQQKRSPRAEACYPWWTLRPSRVEVWESR